MTRSRRASVDPPHKKVLNSQHQLKDTKLSLRGRSKLDRPKKTGRRGAADHDRLARGDKDHAGTDDGSGPSDRAGGTTTEGRIDPSTLTRAEGAGATTGSSRLTDSRQSAAPPTRNAPLDDAAQMGSTCVAPNEPQHSRGARSGEDDGDR